MTDRPAQAHPHAVGSSRDGSAVLNPDGGDSAAFHAAMLAETARRLDAALGRRTQPTPGDFPTALLGGSQFFGVLEHLTGLDPLYLVPALDELSRTAPRRLAVAADRALLALRSGPAAASVDYPTRSDREHPVDFDWRFDQTTSDLIRDRIVAVAPRRLILLGVPTVALDHHFANTQVDLIDDNPSLQMPSHRRSVNLRRVDLLVNPLVTATFEADFAVADPPFYPSSIDAFLVAAATGLRIGGELLLALPSRWARPSAATDVARALDRANAIGLRLIRHDADVARYLTPGFEVATYSRAGLAGVPRRWRTADLAHLRLEQRPSTEPRTSPPSDRHLWKEATVAGSRWRIKVTRTTGSPGPNPVAAAITSDILGPAVPLNTVSRRDPQRSAANVITDDNCAHHSTHPDVLLAVLRATADHNDPHHAAATAMGRPPSSDERTVITALLARTAQSPQTP